MQVHKVHLRAPGEALNAQLARTRKEIQNIPALNIELDGAEQALLHPVGGGRVSMPSSSFKRRPLAVPVITLIIVSLSQSNCVFILESVRWALFDNLQTRPAAGIFFVRQAVFRGNPDGFQGITAPSRREKDPPIGRVDIF